MAYIVIVCSRCRLARGAAETAKTASCPNCGRKLQVGELRKYFRSESLDQIREAIGQLNARLKGGLDIYLEDLYASVRRPLRRRYPPTLKSSRPKRMMNGSARWGGPSRPTSWTVPSYGASWGALRSPRRSFYRSYR